MSIFKSLRAFFSGKSSEPEAGTSSERSDVRDVRPQAMRLRLAEFEQGRVEDVMIPRADIIALDISLPFDDLIQAFSDATHSRLPVYRETLDDPLGFVHIKDVVAELARCRQSEGSTPRKIEQLMRKLLFVPPSMPLADLLVKMQATRIHMAMVIDEYGGTDGLVSLEDLVEEVVGEIEDEHDTSPPMLSRRGNGVYEVDARIEIEDFLDQTEIDMSLPNFEDEIDTLGGVAFALAGRVPERGEVLRHQPSGGEIEIIDADGRRIKRLKLHFNTSDTQEAAA